MTFLRVANRRQRVAVVDAAVSCSQDRGREGSSHSRGASAARRVKAASASASASPTTICGEGNDGVNDQPHGLQHDRDFRVVNKTSGEPNDDDASVVTDLSQRSRSSSSTATSLSLSSHLSLSLNLSDRERPASSTSSSLPHHPESAEEVLADDQATNCHGHSRNEGGNDDNDDDDGSDELSVTSAASASSSCSSSSSSSTSSAAAGQVSRQRSRDGQQPQKRTIFRYYWEKTGQAPLQLQRYDPRPPTFVPAGDGFMHSAQSTMPNTSSRAAASAQAAAHRAGAAAADSAPSRISQSTAASNGNPCAQSDAKGSCRGERQSSLQSQLPRRSILPRNSYASTPTLCMDSSPAGNPMRRHSAQRPDGSMMPLLLLQRKALSTSHLQQGGFHDSSSSLSSSCSTRSKRSCLRQTRYSGSMRRTPEQQPASSDATGVSFDAVVNVQLFHRPIEQHAANGWSNKFAD